MRKLILISLVAVGLMSCGTATNNDQGVAFTAYGWAVPDEEGVCTFSIVTGGTVTMSGGSLIAPRLCFVIGSNLSKQTIRADRMFYEFRIPGASEQPPTTSAPFSVILSPPQEGDGDGEGGDGEGPIAQSVSIGGVVLPNEIIRWISLNRGKLPSAPFRMEGIYRVSGVTSAGDRMETNEIVFNFSVFEDILVTPRGDISTPNTSGLEEGL
jgi:hypothetical protein